MKKIKITSEELYALYKKQIEGVILKPEELSIRTVKLLICSKLVPHEKLTDFESLVDWKSLIVLQDSSIEQNRIEIDHCINLNRSAIDLFFDKVQEAAEGEGELFNKNKIYSFWKNLDGGAYSGGKDFLNNVIKDIVSYTEQDSYKSNVFLNPLNASQLRFDKGAMSFICARPSAGKTTALLNICVDALDQGRKVTFFTAEEPTKQLTVKLIKNLFFKNCYKDQYKKTIPDMKEIGSDTQDFFQNRIKYLYSGDEALRNGIRNRVMGSEASDFDFIDNEIMKSIDLLNQYAQDEKLQIVEVSKLDSYTDLIRQLRIQDEGTIVLLDYIQILPKPESVKNYTQPYQQMKEVIQGITDAVKDFKLIGIAGAQMGRESDKGKETQLLEMSYIREAGDIENFATLLIGLGKKKETQERFYNVMKARNFQYNETKLVSVYDRMKYSFMRTAGTIKDNGFLELQYFGEKVEPENKKSKEEAKKDWGE